MTTLETRMMMKKPPKPRRATALAALQAVALGAALASPALAADKIAVLVKSLGIRFFDAVNQGAQEAAKEIKNIEIIYTGPAKSTAEGQIEIINALISQKVPPIVISANDPDALAPSLKRAMGRGIKVLSFDSGVRKDGRMMHLSPS